MYQIFYHRLVLKDDFKGISAVDKNKIIKTINKKLSADPKVFGKALTGNLKGYFRMRVDFYRVIYRIERKQVSVFVIKIGLRKDLKAYIEAAKRLGLKG